jgi:DNA integrity scanning protein DisA with diadenylate cyclase activity
LAARVGHETAVALRGAGFMDVAQVRDAEDDALLNVPGIGKARLRQIRDVVKD